MTPRRRVSPHRTRGARGFTLIEVLVALMIVAMGLAALMAAVSGAARTSSYLRDKTLAQWIALNRLSEVRLQTNKLGPSKDAAQVKFANRQWHYDTRYFDTTFPSMKRVVVRVYVGDAKTKGNPIAETTGFTGTALMTPGSGIAAWAQGATNATLSPTGTGTGAGVEQAPLTPMSPVAPVVNPVTVTRP